MTGQEAWRAMERISYEMTDGLDPVTKGRARSKMLAELCARLDAHPDTEFVAQFKSAMADSGYGSQEDVMRRWRDAAHH
jgi:hypothetical protein